MKRLFEREDWVETYHGDEVILDIATVWRLKIYEEDLERIKDVRYVEFDEFAIKITEEDAEDMIDRMH